MRPIDCIQTCLYYILMNAKHHLSARERLLQTARRLFIAEGFRAVGIDRIIAEADVAKTTLYSHFPSKDDLIVAVLREQDFSVIEMFSGAVEQASSKGRSSLNAFFNALKKWFQSEHFRGCAFINASVELADAAHPAFRFAAQHKQAIEKVIHDAVTAEHGRKVADAVAAAIALLVEGAIVTALLQQKSKPADIAKKAAICLIESKVTER